MRAKILIVDDEPDLLFSLKNRITFLGHDPLTAENKADAIRVIQDEEPDLILLDLKLTKSAGDVSGLELLKQLRDSSFRSPALDRGPSHTPAGYTTPLVIMLTAFGTVELAVEAMEQGAFSFITKPFSNNHLDVVINKALDTLTFSHQFDTLRKEVARQYKPVTSVNKLMNEQLTMAKRAAPSEATILLLGETGTGKEVVARTIHGWSPRAQKPFVPVNCAAMTETLIESELFGHEKGSFTGATAMKRGQFEQADGGTLFLDEIGDMSLAAQAKVLRALQEKQITRVGGTKLINVDVRVLAATNKDLQQAVRQGTFREDLYHRIAVITLTLPPLRKRIDDLPDLIAQFLAQPGALGLNRRCTVSDAALHALQRYSWPGNVRELENMLTRALILSTGETINLEHLGLVDSARPASQASPDTLKVSYHDSVKAFKRKLIEDVLRRSGWNQTKTAATLGLQRTYFTRLLRELNISGKPPVFPSSLEAPDASDMEAEPAAEPR